MLLLGLYVVVVQLVIPNAVLFGTTYLIARTFTHRGSWQRIVATIGLAIAVAFGPRAPGMLDDLRYYRSDERQRVVSRPLNLPAGTRIGWRAELEPPTDQPRAARELIQFRDRYFPVKVIAGEGGEFNRPRLHGEDPTDPLREAGLVINSGSPANEAVQVHLSGSRSDTHLQFILEVRERDEVVARYSDRFRLRWSGGPSDASAYPILAYLTQNSVLDTIADAAFSGLLVGKWWPVGDFLREAIHIPASPDETAFPGAVVARLVANDNVPVETGPRAVGTESCTPTLEDGLLRNAEAGLVREVRREWELGGEKYNGPGRSDCMGGILTMAYSGSTPGHFMVADYGGSLEPA